MTSHVIAALLWGVACLPISYAAAYLPIWRPVVSRILALTEHLRFIAAFGLLAGMLAVETFASVGLALVLSALVIKVIDL